MSLVSLLLPLAVPLVAPAQTVERLVPLTGFDRIRIEGPFDVVTEDGTGARATVSGDRRALDRLSLRVDSGTLVVSAGGGPWGQGQGAMPARVKLRIVTPPLRAATVNGGGTLELARMRAQRVDVSLTGAGTIRAARIEAEEAQATLIGTGMLKLAGKARRARLRTNGAGALDAAGLATDEATLFAESAGVSTLNARYSATIFAFGAGTITVSGAADCLASGPGEVNCGGKLTRRR